MPRAARRADGVAAAAAEAEARRVAADAARRSAMAGLVGGRGAEQRGGPWKHEGAAGLREKSSIPPRLLGPRLGFERFWGVWCAWSVLLLSASSRDSCARAAWPTGVGPVGVVALRFGGRGGQ